MRHQPEMAVRAAFERRSAPGQMLADDAAQVAAACHDMAVRFHRGGKLIVFGNGGSATDAEHIAVEFVHPVIVGKRALPAISLTNEPATMTAIARDEGFGEVFTAQLRLLASPVDIALGVCADAQCGNVLRALESAHPLGLLTAALTGARCADLAGSLAIDHLLRAHSTDPCVVKEMHVTTYHILWELVHVFLEQPGSLTSEVIGVPGTTA